jgi:hypothetical protein
VACDQRGLAFLCVIEQINSAPDMILRKKRLYVAIKDQTASHPKFPLSKQRKFLLWLSNINAISHYYSSNQPCQFLERDTHQSLIPQVRGGELAGSKRPLVPIRTALHCPLVR